MLTSDQRSRLSLLRKMGKCTRKEGIEALEKNNWDSSMAFEWLKLQKEGSPITLEEFQKSYEEARSKSAVLPQDRYDIPNTKKEEAPNRRARRAQQKKDKKQKKA